MRIVVVLLLVVTGTLATAAPSIARSGGRVYVATPLAERDGAEVIVRGRVSHQVRSVRVQKWMKGRWVTARRVGVHHRVYGVHVPADSSTTTTLRTVAGTTKSRVIRIPAAPAPVSTDACGVQPTKADGSTWACSFVDDFDGTALDRSRWQPQTQFATGVQAAHACYADDPSVLQVSGGTLNLTVRKVDAPVSCSFGGLSGPTNYLAGGVMTYHLFSQQYGRFEARIRNTATTAPGLHEAFWLWPDDRYDTSGLAWPMSGEIDIAETYSTYSSLVIPFLHYGYGIATTPGLNTAWNCAAQRGVFNTYTLTWSPTRLEIAVNGKTCLVNASADPAFKKPYIVALTQALGAAGNVFDGRAPLPATMNVDYVKVWK